MMPTVVYLTNPPKGIDTSTHAPLPARILVEIQLSTSSIRAKNSARTTRLDRYGCSESPGHAHLGQNTCHSNVITSDEVPEKSALHHFTQNAGTELDTDLETDQIERIALPNHTQSTDGPNLTEPTLHSHRTRNKQVVSRM